MRFGYLLLFALFGCVLPLAAQKTFPMPAPSDLREGVYALTNATIYLDYKTRLDRATLLLRRGKIEACAAQVTLPPDAVVIDCAGKTIYPAFIDPYGAGYAMPAPGRGESSGGEGGRRQRQAPQMLSNKPGAYAWNEALRPEFDAAAVFSPDNRAAREWRRLGFAAVLTFRADGISRGTGAVVTLGEERAHESIALGQAAHLLSFRKGSSTQDYPASLMGCIALLRQTYLDGRWYQAEGFKQEKNLSLEAWNRLQALPQIFEADDKLDVLRTARLGQEFGISYIVKTAGDEYQRLDEIKASGQALIVPLTFPEAYDLRDPYDALNVSLRDLKHWELAPSNPARLEAAGIPFVLTAAGLKNKDQFWPNLRKAIQHGLSEQTALKALTWQPAQWLKAAGLGSLEPGKTANFILATGNVFQDSTLILETWVNGKPYDRTPGLREQPDLRGSYALELDNRAFTLQVSGSRAEPEASVTRPDKGKSTARLAYANGLLTLSFQPDSTAGTAALSGAIDEDVWQGSATMPDGRWTSWRAQRNGPAPGADKQTPAAKPETGKILFPFTAYGWNQKPTADFYLIRNATVWTNEKQGVMTNTDVLIGQGKIKKIGKNLPVTDNAVVIDGTGKHLTAGIIDEHSHIAASRSINEGTQESSAEVRIGDVIDSEDIDIYRQLAGGVTSSHILHGSANPIGGQTQLLKMRWGFAPEQLKFENWPGFIKFALGENVKQSNWGEDFRVRYPQTRMGVEQTFVDYFTRAREYGQLKKSGKPYRPDLELEALLEILEGKRHITCHSYVQSEITMLLRVADRMGFKVNTFTHILEGYKVADKMAKHGAGASSFSDWWAYKYEVYEAIPYNAKMMQDRGVLVAINSDDAEMARRLNQEAAKSVLFGGMNEEDAWKMVTLNPAKLLRVDDRVGSIRVGKDADVALWNDNPLSVYARAEKTWVDGILFFDRDEDARRRETVEKERNRIIQKMLSAKKGNERGQRPPNRQKQHYHCDSNDDEG